MADSVGPGIRVLHDAAAGSGHFAMEQVGNARSQRLKNESSPAGRPGGSSAKGSPHKRSPLKVKQLDQIMKGKRVLERFRSKKKASNSSESDISCSPQTTSEKENKHLQRVIQRLTPELKSK
eukprot:2552777-Rhodomonas_salina.1